MRIPARFKVDYSYQGNFVISHTRDISADGMFICTRDPVEPGSRVNLVFSVGDLHEVVVAAEVMWINARGDWGDQGMGVQFLQTPDSLKKVILHMVNRVAILEEERATIH